MSACAVSEPCLSHAQPLNATCSLGPPIILQPWMPLPPAGHSSSCASVVAAAFLNRAQPAMRSWAEVRLDDDEEASQGEKYDTRHAIGKFLSWDTAQSNIAIGHSYVNEFLQVNISSTNSASERRQSGWVVTSSNGGRCSIAILRRHRCRIVFELSVGLGFIPSTAALRASFEVVNGAARRSALLSPLTPCDRVYGIVAPAALAADLEALSRSDAPQLLLVRVFLECEGLPGGYAHVNLWGREMLTAAMLVEGGSGSTPAAAAADVDPSSEPDADLAALLRSFWFDRSVPRRTQGLQAPPLEPGPSPPPAARTTRGYVQQLPPRTSTCARPATSRSPPERRAASVAMYARRLVWQRRLAPTALACLRQRQPASEDAVRSTPLRLVFVGDSHVRVLFAHVVALLGGNISEHCGNWHGDLRNDIIDPSGGFGRVLARISFVWVDGIYENGKHGCRARGTYTGRNTSFPHLPPADVYFVGAPVHWESAFCSESWQALGESAPAYVSWTSQHGTSGAARVWVSANPRGSSIACPACGCRGEGGEGRSNARILRLNALAWSMAAPHGFRLLDTWALFADAFEDEADIYDKVHFSVAKCEPERRAGNRDVVMVGVLDSMRAHTALTRFVCPRKNGPAWARRHGV